MWRGSFIFHVLLVLLFLFISSNSIDEGFIQPSHESGIPAGYNRQQKVNLSQGLKGLYDDHTKLFDFGTAHRTGTRETAVASGSKEGYVTRYNCTRHLSRSFHTTSKLRAKCINIARSKIVDTFAPIMASVGPRGFYMDPATHYNLGDQILVASSVYMLQYFQKRMTWCRGAQTFKMNLRQCSGEMLRLAAAKSGKLPNGKGAFMYYHPGGNWGDMYSEVHGPRKEWIKFIASLRNITLVGGPQTMFYYDNQAEQADASFINTHGNPNKVILTWRQEDSYKKALSLYASGSTIRQSSDMAFIFGQLTPCHENLYDVVVQLRNDQESMLVDPEHGRDFRADRNSTGPSLEVCAGIIAAGYTCEVIQWVTPTVYKISRSNMAVFLKSCTQQAVGVVSRGRVVVTDRLHGTIMSYLSGRSIVYIENLTNKTVGVTSAAFGESWMECMGADTRVLQARGKGMIGINDIVNKAIKLVKQSKIEDEM